MYFSNYFVELAYDYAFMLSIGNVIAKQCYFSLKKIGKEKGLL